MVRSNKDKQYFKKYYLEHREHMKKATYNRVRKLKKTLEGYASLQYSRMQARVRGQGKSDYDREKYMGLEILSKEEFTNFVLSSKVYRGLWEQYVASGFERRLAPTIDRLDPDEGYTLDNMQIVPCFVNNSKECRGYHQEVEIDEYV